MKRNQRRSAKKTEGQPGGPFSAAVAHQLAGRLDEAVANYRKGLESQPDYAEAHYNMALALHGLGRWDEAVASLRRALDIDPAYVDAHNNLGSVLYGLGHLDEAVVSFRRALELRPDLAATHNNLGSALYRLGRQEEAEASVRRALDLRPDFAEAHFNLGNILQRTNRLEEAVAHYERSLSLKPDFKGIPSNLDTALYLLASAGRREAALEGANAWARIDPDDPIAGHVLAALQGGEASPPRASDGYVAALFDGFAERFDDVLAGLNYRAPALIAGMVMRETFSAAPDVLDAGCGTGQVGQLLRPRARTLVGVDLSREMLSRAAGRGVYDRLHRGELTAFMAAHPAAFDVITAADVLIYFGDVAPLFSAAAAALRPGGLVAVSAEELTDAAAGDWRLQLHGRYRQRESYLRHCLASAGLAPVRFERHVLRSESGQDVEGLIALARQ
ncbi:MAG: tetratricopeptide repeat protein, partial [Alphaproteobacteria bacterium]|nr:tetratricopeptide repeat protein [Alphaproteobacteria bacterium]